MAAVIWILLPLFVAAGSALLAFCLMQARMEVALARERETTAMLRASTNHFEQLTQERIKVAEESAHRKAFDAFMADLRVEARHYLRESKSLFLNKKCMVVQERLYFRNIPLSNWIEHEMTVEEGGDLPRPARLYSVFTTRATGKVGVDPSKLIQ